MSPGLMWVRICIFFLSDNGKVVRCFRGQQSFDMPTRTGEDALHFVGRDQEIVEPGTGVILKAYPHSNLARHAAATAVAPMILTVFRIIGRVRIAATRDYASVRRGNARQLPQDHLCRLSIA